MSDKTTRISQANGGVGGGATQYTNVVELTTLTELQRSAEAFIELEMPIYRVVMMARATQNAAGVEMEGFMLNQLYRLIEALDEKYDELLREPPLTIAP